jgi:hypothetical protein
MALPPLAMRSLARGVAEPGTSVVIMFVFQFMLMLVSL